MLKYVHAVQPQTVENNMERRIISHSSKGYLSWLWERRGMERFCVYLERHPLACWVFCFIVVPVMLLTGVFLAASIAGGVIMMFM